MDEGQQGMKYKVHRTAGTWGTAEEVEADGFYINDGTLVFYRVMLHMAGAPCSCRLWNRLEEGRPVDHDEQINVLAFAPHNWNRVEQVKGDE